MKLYPFFDTYLLRLQKRLFKRFFKQAKINYHTVVQTKVLTLQFTDIKKPIYEYIESLVDKLLFLLNCSANIMNPVQKWLLQLLNLIVQTAKIISNVFDWCKLHKNGFKLGVQ